MPARFMPATWKRLQARRHVIWSFAANHRKRDLPMKTNFALSIVTVLLFAGSALALDHRVEALKDAAAPDELAEDIKSQLAAGAVQVIRGTATPLCEIWLCKEWVITSPPQPGVIYQFQPGQLIGAVRYARKGADFRDQDIAEGVYTLRFALQPVDGAHIGTSPTRDFLLLVEAAEDTSAAPMAIEDLSRLSAEAAESSHPAMLSMQKAPDEPGNAPAIRHDEENDWWIVQLQGKAKSEGQELDLPVELVVVGQAAE
jgi:hypothetical protein